MNLQERLQQLAQQREQLWIALHETNGAMKILEQQILETQAAPESTQPSDTAALKQPKETESSKSKAQPKFLKFLLSWQKFLKYYLF